MEGGRFRFILVRCLLALYAASIALLCFADTGNGMEMSVSLLGIPIDKAAHFLMFFPYPALMTSVFGKSGWKLPEFSLFIVAVSLTGVAAGGAIELLQGMTGYRSCDIADFAADCMGIVAGGILTVAVRAAAHKNRKQK